MSVGLLVPLEGEQGGDVLPLRTAHCWTPVLLQIQPENSLCPARSAGPHQASAVTPAPFAEVRALRGRAGLHCDLFLFCCPLEASDLLSLILKETTARLPSWPPPRLLPGLRPHLSVSAPLTRCGRSPPAPVSPPAASGRLRPALLAALSRGPCPHLWQHVSHCPLSHFLLPVTSKTLLAQRTWRSEDTVVGMTSFEGI